MCSSASPFKGMASLLVTLFVGASLCSPPAFAQQPSEPSHPAESSRPVASPDDEQLALNDEAVRAIVNEDYVRAVALLEESLVLGELNVTYLNLGRAYQRLGRCHKARQALEAVKTAPVVSRPSPRVVDAKAAQYLEELGECPEEPSSPDDEAQAEEQDKQEQPTQPPSPRGADHASSPPSLSPPAHPASPRRTWAVASTIGGGVLLASAAGSFLWADHLRDDVLEAERDGGVVVDISQREALQREEDADTIASVGAGMAVAGALATGIGVYMLLSDTSAEQAPAVSVSVGDGSAGFVWRGRF